MRLLSLYIEDAKRLLEVYNKQLSGRGWGRLEKDGDRYRSSMILFEKEAVFGKYHFVYCGKAPMMIFQEDLELFYNICATINRIDKDEKHLQVEKEELRQKVQNFSTKNNTGYDCSNLSEEFRIYKTNGNFCFTAVVRQGDDEKFKLADLIFHPGDEEILRSVIKFIDELNEVLT